ncbi:MAG: hypothetical protein ACRDEA_11000 [Microcystaceae cyanobacterium]
MKEPKKTKHLALVTLISGETSNPKTTDFWNNDVWTASDLGLTVYPGSSESRLYFSTIKQDWLKELIKKFIFIRATEVKFSTVAICQSQLSGWFW